MARESGRPVNGGIDVDLEQLPAYEEAAGGVGIPLSPAPVPQIQRPTPISPSGVHRPAPPANNGVIGLDGGSGPEPALTSSHPPDEPPPGYEETQQNSVANNLERRVEKP